MSDQLLPSSQKKGRILGLDIGDRRIGMAVSDPLFITAQGIQTITVRGNRHAIGLIKDIISSYDVAQIVYGLPKNMDGSLGPRAEKTENFIKKLQGVTGCPCIPWDERLTTMSATKALKEAGMSRKKRTGMTDQVSAILILQNYLDHCKFLEGKR